MAAHLARLGMALNIAITESATISQTYNTRVRAHATDPPEFRLKGEDGGRPSDGGRPTRHSRNPAGYRDMPIIRTKDDRTFFQREGKARRKIPKGEGNGTGGQGKRGDWRASDWEKKNDWHNSDWEAKTADKARETPSGEEASGEPSKKRNKNKCLIR